MLSLIHYAQYYNYYAGIIDRPIYSPPASCYSSYTYVKGTSDESDDDGHKVAS